MTFQPSSALVSEPDIGSALVRAEPLNAVDRAMRAVDLGLRGMSYPGFETQLILWLSGRLNATRLQQALNRLAVAEPLIVSRLQDEPDGLPCWRYTRQRTDLTVATLDEDKSDSVLAYAADQLARPADPTTHAPIRFHLIRRPQSGDVFLMQYNHTLLDNRGSIGLVQRIGDLARDGNDELPLPSGRGDPTRRYLLRFPIAHRRAAAKYALEVWWKSIRGGAATLGRPNGAAPLVPRFRLLTARLDVAQTQAFHAYTLATCGLPATSMSILATAFCALDHLTGERSRDRGWTAGIGVDLGLRRPGGSALHNLMSILPIRTERDELRNRDELVKRLNDQLRRHLQQEVDLGMLQLISTFTRQPHRLRWAVDHSLAHGFSLWYAYFGALDALGNDFLDVPIDDVSYIGPCWSPMGVTLLAQQYQGRLALQVTYIPELVADLDGQAFLQRVRAEIERA